MACSKAFFGLCVLAIVVAGSHSALATDGDPKFEIELGDLPHYADEDSALDACKPDAVIWADRKTGFFYPKFFSEYGKTQYGFYTCYKLALKADYWSLVPTPEPGQKGRVFPQYFCGLCF